MPLPNIKNEPRLRKCTYPEAQNFWKYLLAIMMYIWGCANPTSSYTPSEKEKLCNEVIRVAAKEIYNKTGLIPFGSGGGAMDQIRMLALSFHCRHEVDITEGRKLLIAALETFMTVINKDERIRTYLINYPFEPKNIEIEIFIQNEDGSSVALDSLCILGAVDGILDYQIHTPDGLWLETVHEETYEEALEKLQEKAAVCL